MWREMSGWGQTCVSHDRSVRPRINGCAKVSRSEMRSIPGAVATGSTLHIMQTQGRAGASVRAARSSVRIPALRALSSHRDTSHKGAFVLCEALCLFVMVGGGETLKIVSNFAAVGFICFAGGKTEQRHRDIARTFFTDAGKTECRRGQVVARHEIAMMRAAVFFNQTHPHPRVMLELRQLVLINRVA